MEIEIIKTESLDEYREISDKEDDIEVKIENCDPIDGIKQEIKNVESGI